MLVDTLKSVAVMVMRIRSCECEDEFIKVCLEDAQYRQKIKIERAMRVSRLGSPSHKGTAGELSLTGFEILILRIGPSIELFDLEDSEKCGGAVVQGIFNVALAASGEGRNSFPYLEELNLRITVLISSSANVKA